MVFLEGGVLLVIFVKCKVGVNDENSLFNYSLVLFLFVVINGLIKNGRGCNRYICL